MEKVSRLRTIEKLEQGEKAFIVCAGDSITEQNYHTHGKLNYVGQLTERLMERYNRHTLVLNSGISGNTTQHLLARLESDVIRFKPDLVTVMLGVNDSTWCEAGLPEFEKNLREIIRKITSAGSELLLLTQNPIDFQIESNSTRLGRYPLYVDTVRSVASDLHLPLCDIYSEWQTYAAAVRAGHWTLMNDPVHPNEYGQTFIAETLFKFLGV